MYRDTSSVDCAPRELTHACHVLQVNDQRKSSSLLIQLYENIIYKYHNNMN